MRTFRFWAVVLVASLGLARSAEAQSPSSYILKVTAQGATAPVSTTTLAASGFACAQTPKIATPTTTVLNPTKLVFDDPSSPSTADCVFVDNGSGPLLSIPFGATVYTAVVDVVNVAGTSADSAASNPFSRPGLTANAATGLRVTK